METKGRALGKTGVTVEAVSLGGEGILRTRERARDAVPMIIEALRAGVRYADTAPAYEWSQDYYGAAFRAEPGSRERVFLASKTHERSERGAMALLEDSLTRLGTTHLDLWQMHDLRTPRDLAQIFAKGGAIEAAVQAKKDGKVRFIGLTGHEDPAVLLEAMRTFAFDTVLMPVNAADPQRLPFLTTVLPEARAQGMGVIGMKALGHGMIVSERAATPEECIRYAAAFADTVIIGMSNIEQVRSNLHCGRTAAPMTRDEQLALEKRLAKSAARFADYKR